MPSIFSECNKLKEGYDKCFTTFFQQYVNSEYRHRTLQNPCKYLFKLYKDCVEEGLKREKPFEIDLEEMDSGNSEARFLPLESTLEQFQENARHIGIIVSDFTPKSQEVLNQKIHTMISGLQELNSLKNKYSDIRVPLEVLDSLDEGKNPQMYTATCLERTLLKNKEVNGKIELYRKLHAKLLEALGEEMPAETLLYRQNRNLIPSNSEPPRET
ncbi:unnamed protein product [Bursaphelenchus xylophilus]|uniref:Mediator of RNA polymerase II transcription subunit 10 n=2 Tax=Bursaphelenchus xylophilus TaxID=6326 RepID=A0A7I8WW28_BURXY|nr:unnamed protein product [Bursaphelenchus xylophilus]CAG9098042.1 unnamed protein product [Bursaphelenchus xylophilus]